MTTLTEVLAHYGVDERDLARSLQQAMDRRPQAGAAELSPAEDAFWQKHSGMPHVVAEGRSEDALEEVDLLVGEAADSLTIEQAAQLMGVHRSRVSHRLSAGKLYAFPLGHQRRLPRWQFTEDGEPLPGLDAVLAALPAGMHPLAVAGFFTTPNPDLDGLNAAQWLASGGSPQAVVDELSALNRW